jgi:hypothetical protein
MNMKRSTYPGIEQDQFAGMTDIGQIIRDAWVFGILVEEETCAGWDFARLELLYEQVHEAWAPYGHLVSQLPPELRERHLRIYNEALQKAKALGWTAELGEDD